jgi:hypothetical protein
VRIISHEINYAPEPTSTGKYTGEMCQWPAAWDPDMRVLATPPHPESLISYRKK